MKNLRPWLLPILIALGTYSCQEKPKETSQPPVQEISTAVDQPRPQAIAQAQQHPLTTLAISNNNFNFGTLKQGDKVKHTFTLVNTGDQPLIISQVKPSCGCTVPQYTQTPILPDEKGEVTLTFNSAGFNGTVQKYAEVYTNTERTPVILNFIATVTK